MGVTPTRDPQVARTSDGATRLRVGASLEGEQMPHEAIQHAVPWGALRVRSARKSAHAEIWTDGDAQPGFPAHATRNHPAVVHTPPMMRSYRAAPNHSAPPLGYVSIGVPARVALD